MGASTGFGLKFLQWFIRGVQFCCAALILAIYSYFLAALHNHNLSIASSVRAVEGISGAAALYTLIALLLLCCFAGIPFTSFIAMVLDFCFIGAFIYVAVANKGGASSCSGYLDTPFGKGEADKTVEGSKGFTALPSFHTACKLQTACLAVAIIAIFFFIFSILVELALARHHRKEKRYGPTPQNDYTSGYGPPRGGFFGHLFGRNKANDATEEGNMLPEHPHPDQLNNRTSYATEATAVNHDSNNPYSSSDSYNKYETGYGHPYGGTAYTGAGGYTAPQTNTGPPPDYRYDDGVYDRP